MPALESGHTLLELFLRQGLSMPVVRETSDIEVFEAVVVGALGTFAD